MGRYRPKPLLDDLHGNFKSFTRLVISSVRVAIGESLGGAMAGKRQNDSSGRQKMCQFTEATDLVVLYIFDVLTKPT
jgi:hypothetical protein